MPPPTFSVIPTTNNEGNIVQNPAAVKDYGLYVVDPINDLSLPEGWTGSCMIASTGNVVALVQMRWLGTNRGAVYEAVRTPGQRTRLMIPMAAKRLSNGFATVTTVQNLNAYATAHVTFTYLPAPGCTDINGQSCSTLTLSNVAIPGGWELSHNLRVTSGAEAVPGLPDYWFGTLRIESSDQPIDGMVQLTNILVATGDTYAAHNVFAIP